MPAAAEIHRVFGSSAAARSTRQDSRMASKVAGIVKGLAAAVWGVGALGGLVVGTVGFPSANGSVSVITMLAIWVSAFLSGVFYYAFGEILENVAEIRSNTARQLEISARQAEAISRLLAGAAPTRDEHAPSQARGREGGLAAAADTPISSPADPIITLTTADLRTTDSGATLLTCPSCGLEQPAARKRCWRCAAAFTIATHSE